jgi:hypothetical protein
MKASRISLNRHSTANHKGTANGSGAEGGDRAGMRVMAARLVRAVDTLGRLSRTADARPAGARSAWPDMIRESRFAIEATRSVSRARPSPGAIDDLDRLALLLWRLPPRQRQLLWARACGVRWADLRHRHRRSRTTLNRDHQRALAALVAVESTGGSTGESTGGSTGPEQKSA